MFITCADNKAEKRSRQAASSDRPIRSLAKAVSWRVTGSIDTILLSWFFTGSLTTAAAIGLTEVVTKMVLYYLHERIWNRIPLGRDRCDRYDVTEVLQAESPVA
ncbi:MAG: DUF2061 domain-containing protein [Candidatus Thiodiazotropha sp. (ex Lucina aurantia)]|uniref:DUF2061 domain-containing protein n=2 Tax=Candidatus Thiodiazotropha TaxID=1913444 RepID=A0A7Z1ADA3_9GAMM|nr:DUF2061 domain-containing protein [Candidatus Thiodiazotropha endolucinida]MBT3016155.1 DUF2061 domain-containing protein [Candidatus Thiodiazotropha taylori]MBT3040257.1 DUF2061 domain-containing protein [Candidatus Thiodiazotropha sp. (ex Codakia orbicularis)]MBV2102150.1 DUF2061 domain-containing protein [Candidatus Thiodiazotropha sp. (ex Lucina aurantia)]MBT3022253.1 DUF2061 domain-containing protein [Candidatus Thiodiazotropha taylori]MBT3042815.1 DUF2061 domain-containing protein [Ca